jgi:hypothetical protein
MSRCQSRAVFCRERAQILGVRRDPNPSEIESVCVPAGLNRSITLGQSVAVCTASLGKQEHFLVRGLEKAPLQLPCKQSAPLVADDNYPER